jgi:ABC-type multidrug transport system fused ATPase/permease subunit
MILNFSEDCMSNKSSQDKLNANIERIGKRVERLRYTERRFVWYRLSAFLFGVLMTWITARTLGSPMMWGVLALSLTGFLSVVALNRRLDNWIETLEFLRQLKIRQKARLTLDWEALPEIPRAHIDRDDSLAADLDLIGERSLHHLLDNTISSGGSLRLANWITDGEPKLQHISKRQQLVRELATNVRFRERLLLNYRRTSNETLQGDQLLEWLNAEYPDERVRRALPLALIMAALNILFFGLNLAGIIPAYWPLSMAISLGYYYLNIGSLTPFLETVVRLDEQLSKFRLLLIFLEDYKLDACPNLAKMCAVYSSAGLQPSEHLRRLKLLTGAVGLRMNPFMGLLLNLFLPWDFVTAHLIASHRVNLAGLLPVWLDTLEELEALIALAEYAYLHPGYSYPEIETHSKSALMVKDLGHPLISPNEVVCNDFSLEAPGDIAVITGSNMAGKSTFIKTIGINLCMAYAGGVVHASVFRSIPLRLHTCIHISDSIAEGYSYFYAEVRCLKSLLDKLNSSEEPYPLLYMVDEIFRGTNNRERLIGSQSYLQALIGRDGIGLLATHDLELAALADSSYRLQNYHFRDHVEDGRLAFDYKIRSGRTPTTNALKIMQMEGLPIDSHYGEGS